MSSKLFVCASRHYCLVSSFFIAWNNTESMTENESNSTTEQVLQTENVKE